MVCLALRCADRELEPVDWFNDSDSKNVPQTLWLPNQSRLKSHSVRREQSGLLQVVVSKATASDSHELLPPFSAVASDTTLGLPVTNRGKPASRSFPCV